MIRMQLCKWTLIILVIHRVASHVYLLPGDVNEIMPFTDENKHFIKIVRKEKRYSYRKFIRE